MKHKSLIFGTSILISIVNGSLAYSEELINVRELRPNAFTIESGGVISSSSFIPQPILGLDYNRNITKDISLGLGIKSTAILSNGVYLSTKYFYDVFKDGSVYGQINFGINNFQYDPNLFQKTDIYLTPIVGYESRYLNGLTWGIALGFPYLSLYQNFSGSAKDNKDYQSSNNEGLFRLTGKIGYSF